MTEDDEKAFSHALIAVDPSIRFIDGQRWPSSQPPLVASINAAKAPEVFIWSPVVAPVLPWSMRPDGLVQGPTSGPVIQFDRSVWRDAELRSGRIAAGYDDEDDEIVRFVRTVWQVMKQVTSGDLETLLGHRHPYRIGQSAKLWHLSASDHRLRDRSVLAAYIRVRE
jgi:hypothetical protein